MLLNDLVDQIYVINLDKSTDRLQSITEESIRNKFSFKRIVPVDSFQFSIKPTKDNGWNNNAKSLLETTKLIVKEAKELGYKNILILEDDAKIDIALFGQFLVDYDHFRSRFRTYDFIHLYHSDSFEFSLSKFHNFRLTKDGCLGCVAYIIHEQIYDSYLKELEKNNFPIDHTVKKIQFYRRRSFIYEPEVVIHEKNKWSTLRESIVNY